MAARQSVIERLFVDKSTAGAIDDAGAFFHEGDALPVENEPSLGSHRQMQSQEIRLSEHFVEIVEELNLKRSGASGREIRIVSNWAHPESDCPPSDLAADPSHAEDS